MKSTFNESRGGVVFKTLENNKMQYIQLLILL